MVLATSAAVPHAARTARCPRPDRPVARKVAAARYPLRCPLSLPPGPLPAGPLRVLMQLPPTIHRRGLK